MRSRQRRQIGDQIGVSKALGLVEKLHFARNAHRLTPACRCCKDVPPATLILIRDENARRQPTVANIAADQNVKGSGVADCCGRSFARPACARRDAAEKRRCQFQRRCRRALTNAIALSFMTKNFFDRRGVKIGNKARRAISLA
jgi:hypothetical protein